LCRLFHSSVKPDWIFLLIVSIKEIKTLTGDFMRPSNRAPDQLRSVDIETGVSRYAEGSCLIKMGNTHVLCTASVDDKCPPFLKNTGLGWATAEYGMLPRATHTRMSREAKKGQAGRTQEIQRLIGRSLRAGLDRVVLGERQILIDCDVIQADGGTRTASITGGFVALMLAAQKLLKDGVIRDLPVAHHIAAVSCGIYEGKAVLDLDYDEDSKAETDANFVLTDKGHLVEVQASAESRPFTTEQFNAMLMLAQDGVKQLIDIQRRALTEVR
jgi:ribonuclease PH